MCPVMPVRRTIPLGIFVIGVVVLSERGARPSTPEALEQAYLALKTAKKARTVLEDYKRTMETEKPDQGAFRASVADDQKHSSGRQNRARCAMLPTLSRRYPAGSYLCRSRWIQNLHRWREKRASTNPFYIKTAVQYSQMTAPGN